MKFQEKKSLGIFFVLVGTFFGYHSLEYNIGSLTNISSGFFPFWLSMLLILLGIIIFLSGIKNDISANSDLKIPLYILCSLIAFIFIFKYTGFLFAGIFLIWATAIIHKNFSFIGTVIISIVYSLIILLLNIYILNSLPL